MAAKYLDSSVVITPSTTGSWVDIDVSSYLPSGAKFAIIHLINSATSGQNAGWRMNGSTDNRYTYATGHRWILVGLDSSLIFEFYRGSSYISIRLEGYLTEGVGFVNGVDKTPIATGSWLDVDTSAECGTDIPLAALFEIDISTIGVRNNGSTDNRYQDISHAFAIVGVDSSKICEAYKTGSTAKLYLAGYLTKDITMYVNGTDVSLSTTATWTDLPALPDDANAGIYEIVASAYNYSYGLRKNSDNSEVFYRIALHDWGIVECDSDKLIEGKINNTAIDFFQIGYFKVEASSSGRKIKFPATAPTRFPAKMPA